MRIEAYHGSGAKAKVVGEAADCEARDEKTHEVTLQPNKETPVPVLVDPDFDGPEVEIRVSDPQTPRGVGEAQAEERHVRIRSVECCRKQPRQERHWRLLWERREDRRRLARILG